jgi:hypothetical protein
MHLANITKYLRKLFKVALTPQEHGANDIIMSSRHSKDALHHQYYKQYSPSIFSH